MRTPSVSSAYVCVCKGVCMRVFTHQPDTYTYIKEKERTRDLPICITNVLLISIVHAAVVAFCC